MEDFVPCGLAVKLKEKGFNEKCYTFYEYNSKEFYREESIPCCNSYSDDYAAPTISQVLKWLRKKKNIFVVTFIADDSDTPLTYEIYMGTECLLTHHGEYFTLQEWDKCNLVGIEYVVDNLI